MGFKKNQKVIVLEWRAKDAVIAEFDAGVGIQVPDIKWKGSFSSCDDDAICDALKNIVETTGNVPYIIGIIPRSAVIVRFIDLPSSDEDEIRSMIELQLEQHFPYAINEMYYDFVIYSGKREGYSKIALLALSMAKGDVYINAFKKAGIVPDLLTVSSWLQLSAFYSSGVAAENVCVLDIVEGNADISYVQKNTLLNSRSFSFEKEKNTDFYLRLKDEIKRSIGDVQEKDVVFAVLGKTFEIAKMADFFDAKIENIIKSKNISSDISLSLCGVSSLSDVKKVPDLLPCSFVSASERHDLLQGKKLSKIAALVFLTVVVTGVFSLFFQQFNRIKKYEVLLSSIGTEAKQLAETIEVLDLLDRAQQKQKISLELIYQIHTLIPNTIYLTALDYEADNTSVSIRGVAKSISQVSDLVLRMQKSELLKNAEVRYAKNKKNKDEDQVDFEITCLLSGAKK